MPIATLSIDLIARLAQFEQGMDRAARISEKQAADIEKAFSNVGTAIKGLGLAALITQQIDSARQAINTADRVDDLAEKYGIAADKLSQYRYAAEVAGTPTEALASGFQKLSKAASEGNKGLALIGVRTKDATGNLRETDEILLDVAEKFSRYEDGAAKAALAQEIFGKSGADMIPLLNKGRAGIAGLRDEAVKLGAAFGSDLAKQAGDFNDNLKRLELGAEGAKIALVGQLLPSLIAITEQLIAGQKAYNGFLPALLDIGINIDPFKSVAENLKATNQEIAVYERQLADIEQRATSPRLVDQFNNIGMDRQAAKIKDQVVLLKQRAQYLKDEQSRQALLASAKDYSNEGRSRGRLQAPTLTSGEDAKGAKKEYDALITSIMKKRAEAENELSVGLKLSDAQKFGLDVVEKLAQAESKLTAEQKRQVAAALDATIVLMDKARAQQELAKTVAATAAINDKQLALYEREAEALIGANEQLRDQAQQYGLSSAALQDLTVKRIDSALAQEQLNLVTAQNIESNEAEVRAIQRKIRLLEQQRGLRNEEIEQGRRARADAGAGAARAVQNYLDKIHDAGTETERAVSGAIDTLEDDLTKSLSSGKLSVSNFIDYVISESLRLTVVRPLLDSIFGKAGGATGIGSFIGSLISGNRASGGPVSAGRLYEVNERGMPEMLTVGSRQLLLMGRQGGRVSPAAAAQGSASPSVTVINNVQAGVTRGEVMQAIQLGMQSVQASVFSRLKAERVIA